MLVLQDQEWLQIRGKCSYAHRQVDEQPSKRSKKNDDKSAVAMLKKNDWHENVRQTVVNHGKSHVRSARPDKNRDHELKRGPTGRHTRRTCPSLPARRLVCWSVVVVRVRKNGGDPLLREQGDLLWKEVTS